MIPSTPLDTVAEVAAIIDAQAAGGIVELDITKTNKIWDQSTRDLGLARRTWSNLSYVSIVVSLLTSKVKDMRNFVPRPHSSRSYHGRLMNCQ